MILNVDGFIVQPFPKQMDQEKIIMAINLERCRWFSPRKFWKNGIRNGYFFA